MRPVSLLLAVAAVLSTMAMHGSTASAQTMVYGQITTVRTGWSEDSIGVVLDQRTPNPASCPNASGAISHKSLPGYSTYVSVALAALTWGKRVKLTVHNTECYGGWPKLIGLDVYQ